MFGALYFAQYPTTVTVVVTSSRGKWSSWIVLTHYEKTKAQLLTDNNNE